LSRQIRPAFIVQYYKLAHDRPMKKLLTKLANFLASLIATDHDERLYSDY
jgi:hypothetical protein